MKPGLRRAWRSRIMLSGVVAIGIALLGCPAPYAPAADAPSEPVTDSPPEPQVYTYVFLNQSSYEIDIAPTDGQTWDSFSLIANLGRKTLKLEVTEVAYLHNYASIIDVATSNVSETELQITFTDATLSRYYFENNSSIHLEITPGDGQVWSPVYLLDWSMGVGGNTYNRKWIEVKYRPLSFTYRKYVETNVPHWDNTLSVEDIEIVAQGSDAWKFWDKP